MPNPFIFGNPLPPAQFIDRKVELRRIVGRILRHGQSSALVGEPRSGKTSLLKYISAPEMFQTLYGAESARLTFSFLDADRLSGEFSAAQFWEYALGSLAEKLEAPGAPGAVQEAYRVCQQNQFGNFVLERLFAQMQRAGLTLALILDEFDKFLYHPVLNKAEFFGGLRSLASLSGGSLALVIASRQSLTALNTETQSYNRTGSPYFNIFEEITLGALDPAAIEQVFKLARKRFSEQECSFLVYLAGGQPFFLQAAASALWDAYEEGLDEAARRQAASDALYRQSALTLSDTWRLWSAETKKAFTTIALDQIPALLGERSFDVQQLVEGLADYQPELRALKDQGWIAPDGSLANGWRVRPVVFTIWLADELVKALRQKDELGHWLQEQGWEGLLKHGEKAQLLKAAQAVGGLLKGGLEAFIKATAEGFGKGISNLG